MRFIFSFHHQYYFLLAIDIISVAYARETLKRKKNNESRLVDTREGTSSRFGMISVVILNFNGKAYLKDCLTSVLSQTFRDFEVIVVDNGSSDGSAEYLETNYPWVNVVKNEKNLGFAEGTNTGIKQAKGEYILTLNNDTQMDNRFLECLERVMKSDKCVGMCAPKMLFCDGSINSTGICISLSGAAWDRGMSEPDKGQYDSQEEVFGPCAGAALYRKKMLEEIGLFDEDFFLYMEDVDLAFRGRLAGWKCFYVPDAKVYHIYGGTTGSGSDLSVYYGNRNILWYVAKDFPGRLLIKSLPWIIGRSLAVVLYYSRMGKGRIILKSKLDSLKGLPRMLRKRGRVVRKVHEGEIGKSIHYWARMPRR
jgi:GT2 family glycosyltransferase